MKKRIYFQMVADECFTPDIMMEIKRLDNAVCLVLASNAISFNATGPYLIDFSGGSKQYRISYYVDKDSSFTYKHLYALINRIKPVHYTVLK